MKKLTKKKIIKGLAGKDKRAQKFVEDGIDNFGGKKEAIPNFSVTLTIANNTYQGVGATALEALQALPKPAKMMNKGTLVLSDGLKKTNPVLMYPVRLRRLFYGKLAQAVQLKALCLAMK